MQATDHLESIRPAARRERQNQGWGATILTGLPHLLMGLLLGSSSFFPQNQSQIAQIISAVLGVSLAILVIYVITRARREYWPLWSASWYGYLTWVVLAIIALLINLIDNDRVWVFNMALLFGWLGAVVLGYLYMFSFGRLRSLLAILFLFPLVGQLYLEFIPNQIEGALAIGTGGLVAVTAALVLRSGKYRRGLLYSILTTLVLALSFAYVGVYQASDLPDFIQFNPQFSDFVSMLVAFLVIGTIIYGLPPVAQWVWEFFRKNKLKAQ